MFEPDAFMNRELSWLQFNRRVLDQAGDKRNPLMERLKFLGITTSNLEEFFMVRMAGLREQIRTGYAKPDASGLLPSEQLRRVTEDCRKLMGEQYQTWCELTATLKQLGIVFLTPAELSPDQKSYAEQYYRDVLSPVLTPLGVDASHPFPYVAQGRLYVAARFKARKDTETRAPEPTKGKKSTSKKKEERTVLIQVPALLPRFLPMPGRRDAYIFLEDIIGMHLDQLLAGYKATGACAFRLCRDGDLDIDEDAEDLMREIENSIKQRKQGQPVRLDITAGLAGIRRSPGLEDKLRRQMKLKKRDVFNLPGPLDFTFLFKFAKQEIYSPLTFAPCAPHEPAGFRGHPDIFQAIANRDVLVHHPYESFDCVVRFLQQAAEDPQVLAIKMTLYRVSHHSPIVAALMKAAQNGKQVTVLVELKARFDEENNISWARMLESAGCHVVFGMAGLKVHCKVVLVARNEENALRRYVHLGTGNYNDATANLYTDFGLFTCDPGFGEDAAGIFNALTGFTKAPTLRHLVIAPTGLRGFLEDRIRFEAQQANQGRTAHIIAKMNSLVDEGIIQELYRASQAGVKIELIIRGICCLLPGIEGLSDNIRVISIVGRYLEHHRVFSFHHGGEPQYFLSSADWMNRNLDRRVEVCFPVLAEEHKERLRTLLQTMLNDNQKASLILPNGGYAAIVPTQDQAIVNSQEACWEEAATELES